MTLRTGGLIFMSAAAVAISSSFSAFAQQAPSPPLVIQIGVDLIQLDAAVTDKAGRPVTDLRPEDFTLEIDGRKHPVANAAYFGQAPDAVRAAEGEDGGKSDCTVVFIVDDLNMSFGSMYATREALARFAQEMGSSRPLVALRLASDEEGRFTLYRSADRFATAARALRYNIRSSKGVSSVRAASQTSSVSIATTLNRTPLTPEAVSALTPTEERRNLEQRAFSLVSTINTLRGIPGRKAVVYVSEGFYVDNRTQAQLDTGFPFSSLFDDTNISAALRMITEVANRASVVLYTVDPRGLMGDFIGVADNVSSDAASDVMRSRADARMGSQATLQYLADDTGGLAIANRNDLKGGFGDVVRDQGAYYLIGFEPPESAFVKSSGRPRFHKIKLSVNRKGVRVRTRAGFYGVTDDEVSQRAPLATSPDF